MWLSKNDEKLSVILKTLPEVPGVYQFLDDTEKIIYIGKAINLRKRVSSYFTRDITYSGKVMVMLKRISDIRHIVVETEIDALLLENNLIKKYQPRYNVHLKDDKTFPWICIKNEPFPRIFPTRNLVNDGSRYFGPYASVRMMNTLLELVRQLFRYRTCQLNLSQEKIKAGKYKVCLQYHIGNCLGPCEGKQSQEDYKNTVDQITEILKGNLSGIINQLKGYMQKYAREQAFEMAQAMKYKIEILEKYQSKSMVVSASVNNIDVYSIVSDEEYGYVNFLKVANGAIIQSHTMELKKRLDEPDAELIEMAITEIRYRYESSAKEIVVSIKPNIFIPGVQYTLPRRGDKKKLVELSERNAKYYRLERLKQKELIDSKGNSRRILGILQKDLNLPLLPEHIECFDNSNTQGSYPVAACVVFRNGRPSKNEYRHFNIKTVEGPDDYTSMEEVVFRRYKRMLDQQEPLPQLVVVDGGKGQLRYALAALHKLGLKGKIIVIGIAKRLEEIFLSDDNIPVYIDKTSESLKLIQQMRDEAHRFGLAHHRLRRQKGGLKSELFELKGIGTKTGIKLLKRFKSLHGIINATLEEIASEVGKNRAGIIKKHFSDREKIKRQ